MDLTDYDIKPEGFINYIRYNGKHFNKNLCEFACSLMEHEMIPKDKVEQMFKQYNAVPKQYKLYDHVYLLNWCKQVLHGGSIADDRHMAMFVRDILDKEGDLVFNRWYADMAVKGEPIDWEEMI